MSFEKDDNPDCLQNLSDNRYLAGSNVVLPGSLIFEMFFEGTQYKDIDDRGNEVICNLKSRATFEKVDQYF